MLIAIAPALGGLTGAAVAARSLDDEVDDGIGRAAYGAGAAAAGAGLAAIALTWSSQRFAKLDGSTVALLVPLVAWWFTSAGLVTSVGALLRAAPHALGRTLFALSLGGALGALASPLSLELGCPRTLLAVGFLCAAAAWLLVVATRAPLQRPVLATIPLALLSLSLGDIRSPWLKIRTDVGRKGRVGLSEWTAHGLYQVDQGKAGILNYTVDRGALRPLSLDDKAKRRQAFDLSDMAYFHGVASGAALVVGSGGARDIREAIDAGHPRVDAIEPSSAFPRAFDAEFAKESGFLLHQPEKLTVRFGDPRVQLRTLRESYDRILVVGEPALEPLPSRFFADASRILSAEAIRDYLGHLAEPRGVLLLRAPKKELPDLLASAAFAIEPGPTGVETLAQRAVACAERKDDGAIGLLVAARPLAGPELQNISKSCKRKGLTVEYPVEPARNGDRDRDAKQRASEAAAAIVSEGTVVRDDRPFFDTSPNVRALREAARESMRGLRSAEPAKAKGRDDKDGAKAETPRITGIGIATSAAAITLFALLLLLVIPVARVDGGRFPLGLRAGAPWLGGALGGGLVVLDDAALRLLGGVDAAWSVVVPMSTLALGCGFLLADVIERRSAGKALAGWSLVAVALLVVVGVGSGRVDALSQRDLPVRLACAFAVLFLGGASLGASFGAMLRSASRSCVAGVAWLWGAYIAAAAVGAATAQLVVRYVGVSKVAMVAAVALGFGAMQATVAGLRRRAVA